MRTLIIRMMLFLVAEFYLAEAQQLINFRLATVSPAKSVHVVGDFNGWSRTSTPMADPDGDGIWEAKVQLAPGIYQYRYLIDDGIWIKDPTNPVWEGEYSNSVLSVTDPAVPQLKILRPIYGECFFNEPIEIALQYIDGEGRHGLDLAATQVLINGQPKKFNFNIKTNRIECRLQGMDDGEYVLEISAADRAGNSAAPLRSFFWVNQHNQSPTLDAGHTMIAWVNHPVTLNQWVGADLDNDPLQHYQWKMLAKPVGSRAKLNNSWIPFPSFKPDKIGRYVFSLRISDGRLWSNVDSVDVFVFDQQDHPVQFQLFESAVRARYQTSITTAAVAGEFNRWSATANPMNDRDHDGVWTAWLDLDPGEYEYKFVVNDSLWLPDPENPRQVSDGWNGLNSILTVSSYRPIARANAKLVPGKIIIDASASSSPLGKSLDFSWIQDIKNPKRFPLSAAETMRFPIPHQAGNYYFYLVATDKHGGSALQKLVLSVDRDLVRIRGYGDSPDWARDVIIYEIFVRQFTPSGDLQGVIEKLDYLKDLGINCIWLMPIWEGPTRHGYGPSDFFQIESDYGTLEDFKTLVSAAHNAGIKIILDFIANHTSDQHPYFLAAYHFPASPFRDWFRWRSDKKRSYYAYEFHNDWDTLPNLNYENPNVRQYILSAANYWASLGVDGFRCDVAWGVPHDFWRVFRRSLKKNYPDLLLIDEVLPRSPAYHRDQFDMSYDTDFYGNLLDVMRKRKPLSAIDYGLNKTKKNYPEEALDFRYIENHDMDRFITQFGLNRTKLAAALLLTIPGTPLIYYGQEQGLTEKTPPMDWKQAETDLFQFYRKLIHLRRRHLCLRRGDMMKVATNAELDVYAFLRKHGEEQVLVVLNFSDSNRDCLITLPSDVIKQVKQPWLRLENSITGEPMQLPIVAGDQIRLQMPPETPYVFVINNKAWQ